MEFYLRIFIKTVHVGDIFPHLFPIYTHSTFFTDLAFTGLPGLVSKPKGSNETGQVYKSQLYQANNQGIAMMVLK